MRLVSLVVLYAHAISGAILALCLRYKYPFIISCYVKQCGQEAREPLRGHRGYTRGSLTRPKRFEALTETPPKQTLLQEACFEDRRY